MYLGNIAGLIVVLTTVPLFASILRIPFSIIAPVIIVICAIGAYTVHNAMLDIWFMLGFGVVGYVFKKLDYPLAPLVLALVLGDKAEDSFRQAMLVSQGDLTIMWSNALVGSITTLALADAVLAADREGDRCCAAPQGQSVGCGTTSRLRRRRCFVCRRAAGAKPAAVLHCAHVPRFRPEAESSSFTSLRATPQPASLRHRRSQSNVAGVAARRRCDLRAVGRCKRRGKG